MAYVGYPEPIAFFAYNSATRTNQTGNNANATVTFDSTLFDIGSNFASNTFTAPIAGIYAFSMGVLLTSIGTGMANILAYIVAPSATTGYGGFSPVAVQSGTSQCGINGATTFSLSAGDTVYVTVQVQGGAGNTAGFFGQAIGPTYTYFCGNLLY
jgi:hypothetical protein